MKLIVAFEALLVTVYIGSINGESTDIELDRKAMRMHQIDSLVSGLKYFQYL